MRNLTAFRSVGLILAFAGVAGCSSDPLGAAGGARSDAGEAPPPPSNGALCCPDGQSVITVGDAAGQQTSKCMVDCPAGQHYNSDFVCVSNNELPKVTALTINSFGVSNRAAAENDPFKMAVTVTVTGDPFESSVRPYIRLPLKVFDGRTGQIVTKEVYVCSPGNIPIRHAMFGTEKITAEATGVLPYECTETLRQYKEGRGVMLEQRIEGRVADAFTYSLAFDPDKAVNLAGGTLPPNLLSWSNLNAFMKRQKADFPESTYLDKLGYYDQRRVIPGSDCTDPYKGGAACAFDVHGPVYSLREQDRRGEEVRPPLEFEVNPPNWPGRAKSRSVIVTKGVSLVSSAVSVVSDINPVARPALQTNVSWQALLAPTGGRESGWGWQADKVRYFIQPADSEIARITAAWSDAPARELRLGEWLEVSKGSIEWGKTVPISGRTENQVAEFDPSFLLNTPWFTANRFKLMACAMGDSNRSVGWVPPNDRGEYRGNIVPVLDPNSTDPLDNPPPCPTTEFAVTRIGGPSFRGRIELLQGAEDSTSGDVRGAGNKTLNSGQQTNMFGSVSTTGVPSSHSAVELGASGFLNATAISSEVSATGAADGRSGTGGMKLDLFGINVVNDPSRQGDPQPGGGITIPISELFTNALKIYKNLTAKPKVGVVAKKLVNREGLAWHMELKWGPMCGPEGCVTLVGDLYAGAAFVATASIYPAPNYPCINTDPNVTKCYRGYTIPEDTYDARDGSGVTLEDASNFCQEKGGRLAVISSDAENALAQRAALDAEQAVRPVSNAAGVRPRPWIGAEKTTAYLFRPADCRDIVKNYSGAGGWDAALYRNCVASGTQLWGFASSQRRLWTYDSRDRAWRNEGGYNKLSQNDVTNDGLGAAVLDPGTGNWVGVSGNAGVRNYPLCEFENVKAAQGLGMALDVTPSLAGGADISVIYGDPDFVGFGASLGLNLVSAELAMKFGREWATITALDSKRRRVGRVFSDGVFDLKILSGDAAFMAYFLGASWRFPFVSWDGVSLYKKTLWDAESSFVKPL